VASRSGHSGIGAGAREPGVRGQVLIQDEAELSLSVRYKLLACGGPHGEGDPQPSCSRPAATSPFTGGWRRRTTGARTTRAHLVGLHCHIGSQITSIKAYEKAARRMIDLLAAVRDEHGVVLPQLDLGGGQ
jgi:hypothetical protein